jgi:hypothetical protein
MSSGSDLKTPKQEDVMSNDNYERAVKLWISLWKLVLDQKRHLESVCATLQQLVFDKTGYPRHKNWPAICELGRKDHLLMMALATLDSHRTDEQAQRIIAAFPDCFSDKETHEPIPWSLIRKNASDWARRKGMSADVARAKPVSCEGFSGFDIPLLGFGTDDEALKQYDQLVPLPPSFADAKQGDIVKWGDHPWFVAERNADQGEVWVVPAECIAPDL